MIYYGLPQTKTKPTVLVYCEGLEDAAFLKYLKNLYHQDNADPRVTIQSGRGGTADGIVLDASNIYGDYTHKIVVLDNDKKSTEMKKAKDLAQSKSLILVLNTPCMERLLLDIIQHPNLKPKMSSGKCKRIFEESYFIGLDRTDWADYRSVFLKRMINGRMKTLNGLMRMYYLSRGRIGQVGNDALGIISL